MLVLSRNPEESILIGDDVEVTVLAARGDKVRLGITAPREKTILRSELAGTPCSDERRLRTAAQLAMAAEAACDVAG